MIILSVLIYLPSRAIAAFAVLIIAGHDVTDYFGTRCRRSWKPRRCSTSCRSSISAAISAGSTRAPGWWCSIRSSHGWA